MTRLTTVVPLLIVVILFLGGCAGGVDQAKFHDVYGAAKSVQNSVSVGLSYDEYRRLLQKYATEVSIAEDRAQGEKEKEMVGYYAGGLGWYETAKNAWDIRRRLSAGPFSKDTNKALEKISEDTDKVLEQSLQASWRTGDVCIGLANDIYLGRSSDKTDESVPNCKH